MTPPFRNPKTGLELNMLENYNYSISFMHQSIEKQKKKESAFYAVVNNPSGGISEMHFFERKLFFSSRKRS